MSKVSELQHRANARRYVDNTNRANAKLKEERKSLLSSAKEKLVEKTIHKIESEISQKGLRLQKQTFTGFNRPWKKK